ncbi:MAG TPA: protease pro-enzyme activation domain-containing protein [Candidatus Sulfotelmatobacter sp.]|nr:protease pro-enzyme activation domain-containing protein [Candidatus Sulfotelmatobacter sp.]
MSKTILKFGLGLLAAAGMVWPAAAAVTGTKTLHGHVPAVVAQLASTGRLPSTNVLHLAIGLQLRDQAGLNELLKQIYDPSSTNYQKYLTPDEFTARFSPSEQDYQSVITYANASGFKVTGTHPNRMLVDVTASAGAVEQAMNVHLRTYHHPTENREFFAPDTEPTVSASLPVLSIQGLSSYVLPHPLSKKITAAAAAAHPANGSGPQGGYMGQDFRTAYIPGSSLNGSGQTVGLLQFDGYFPSDISSYESLAGLTNVPLHNVLLDGFNGSPGQNNTEVCLDIETSISMAPALSAVVLFEAGPFGNPDDVLSSMTASNSIKQFSASWAYGIDATTDELYQQLAVQGQTFLNASGDGDAWLGPIPWGSLEDPNITIVGGTTLTMNGVAVSYSSERAWNWGYAGDYNFNPDGYAGTSGGVSTDVPIPIWQQGFGTSTNHGSANFRNVPDIALTADNVFVVSSGGQEGLEGGTSCASPLFAGFMALVNQQAAINGLPSAGFLAPKVYSIASTTNYTTVFHDVMLGSNTWDQSLTNFYAIPGYDLCTGLGTPNGTNFVNALAGVNSPFTNSTPFISAPRSPWGTTLSVMNGGNPNGDWFLFVMDDTPVNYGGISNGWAVTLTSANPVGFASDNETYATPALTNLTLGGTWTVCIAVTNYGPSYSTNVVVTDLLPISAGLTLVSSNATLGSLTQFGSSMFWTLGNLATNIGGTLNLVFHAGTAGSYTNTANVNSTTPDPNPDDDTAVAVANVFVSTPPILSASATSHGQFSFHVDDTNGATSVIVQGATNLVPPITWLNLLTNTTPFTFTDLTATNFPIRFYRVVTGP